MRKLFLTIENGEGIRTADLIGVFDFDEATRSEATGNCLKRAQKSFRLVNAANDLPKTLILKEEAYGDRIYLSGLSSDIIIKRIGTQRI
ncbi:MAG: hypothetical protein ILO68_03600 [Clostridia bacterium]|nr:hypothetical protein [Clostridia bacterium]